MNPSPRLSCLVALLLVLFATTTSAQTKPLGQVVNELQAIQFQDKDFPFAEVPPLAQQLLSLMKQGLRQEILDALADERNASASPAALREAILRSLRANNVEIWSPRPDERDGDTSALYGRLLAFDVVRPKEHSDLLAFRTQIRIPCGDDSSLYIFQRTGFLWKLAISREQNNYGSISDARGRFEFQISPSGDGAWFVVAVDVNPWCTSNWQAIRYEVLRPSFTPDRPRVLLSEEKEIYLGVDDVYDLSVRKNGFELKYAGGQSLDAGLLTRDHVENYSVHGDRVTRIPPFAVEPEDFLDEWIEMPWEDAKPWTSPTATVVSKSWHAKLKELRSGPLTSEFDFVQPCSGNISQWQIGLSLQELHDKESSKGLPRELFFTILKSGERFFVHSVDTIRPAGCPGRKRPRGI